MKRYLITSPEHYTQNAESFAQKLEASFVRHKPDMALYRDKQNAGYKELAALFVFLCKKHKIEAFLHGDALLAAAFGADGVHLTSQQYDAISKAKEQNILVGISAHTKEEVMQAQKLGASYVTYSPIFASPNKGEPKGVEALKEVLEVCSIEVFALGGIVDERQIKEIAQTNAAGFSSIRYFYDV
ncbi:MAG: thiamine phosphate synthase [Sulfurimonas sp.]